MSTVSRAPSSVAVDQSETETVEQVRWARVNRLSRSPQGLTQSVLSDHEANHWTRRAEVGLSVRKCLAGISCVHGVYFAGQDGTGIAAALERLSGYRAIC